MTVARRIHFIPVCSQRMPLLLSRLWLEGLCLLLLWDCLEVGRLLMWLEGLGGLPLLLLLWLERLGSVPLLLLLKLEGLGSVPLLLLLRLGIVSIAISTNIVSTWL